jgi:glycosyltransferase involved in cell wall biosynthesis
MSMYGEGGGRPMRILVLTRSYPSADDLYQYPFVHRRVLAYAAAGHEVCVFRLTSGPPGAHDHEGVTCRSGDAAAFRIQLKAFRPDVIAAHGLSESMWPALEGLAEIPVRAWLHGSEIPAFFRCKAEAIRQPAERARTIAEVQARSAFWNRLLAEAPDELRFVFPSRSALEMMREDCGELLSDDRCAIVPNPIDTRLFGHRPKTAQDRLSILSIRPYDFATYANDLSVAAVLRLAKRADFGRLRFTFIGEGPLFDETLAPIAGLPNVDIRRGFLRQSEIAIEHRRHGIFLVPTRLDTHGVSRDEAMASGLVPVTNALPVVREFVDSASAGLAPADDSDALADEIARMVDEPALFLSRSRRAADRVLRERGHERIIPAELRLLSEAACLPGLERRRA